VPRGGKRQGTPGKGYANRTDLGTDPNMGQNTAATGGLTAPAPVTQSGPERPQVLSRTPDDSPMLTAPSQRPGEPITAGLDFGAGPDSSALGMQSYSQQRQADIDMMKAHLPMLKAATKFKGAPETFIGLVNYLSRL
jgi:hypothetical protein